MNIEKLLSEHTGPCIHSAEWYKEQAEEAERHWRELLLLCTRLDRSEIRRMISNDNKRRLKELLNDR